MDFLKAPSVVGQYNAKSHAFSEATQILWPEIMKFDKLSLVTSAHRTGNVSV